MERKMLFYGLINLIIGIMLFAVFAVLVPDFLDSLSVECINDGILACGSLLELVKNIAILIAMVGLLQILYWIFFEKKNAEISIAAPQQQAAYKLCPDCNAANEMDAGFCKTCGRNLKPKAGG